MIQYEQQIARAAEAVEAAKKNLRTLMEAAFPEGSRIGFRLRDSQLNLSWGTCVGVHFNEPTRLVIRMDGGHVSGAHWSAVERVEPGAS